MSANALLQARAILPRQAAAEDLQFLQQLGRACTHARVKRNAFRCVAIDDADDCGTCEACGLHVHVERNLEP